MSAIVLFKTKRFLVREFTEQDREAFVACHLDPQFAQFHLEHERGREHATSVFSHILAWRSEEPRENFQLVIALRHDAHAYVGNVGLRMRGLPTGAGELGIELVPKFWRVGAATEIMRAFLPWARDKHGIVNFVAETAPGNIGAERLAASAGLRIVSHSTKRYWRSDVT
ncbi:GNAT family N-acetyltransferase [Nitratireductor sp. ZSWI3]|uniref:GNAT family N-acetyltransferase n=1 Tax=Nitratireductor sp. ZSWI3 TaxID=2966359 RepID=UPI00214FC8F5|nr:GNAT family N-acetyltransferase [Nitratireductor sp. ZSWI3]MCR4265801.1 GNAT family N-acetyltransferase [Nitratireductor sp. ZSWI3]